MYFWEPKKCPFYRYFSIMEVSVRRGSTVTPIGSKLQTIIQTKSYTELSRTKPACKNVNYLKKLRKKQIKCAKKGIKKYYRGQSNFSLIEKLDSENIEYFLMGDLNCDMIATRHDNNTCKLMSITDIYGLQQLITEPTRITPTSATLIDVIYTNCPDKVVFGGSSYQY